MAINLTGHDVSTPATAATGELLPGFFVSEAEERALRLIGGWFDETERRAVAGEAVSAELTAHFHAWLDDPRDRRAKERALDIIMEGCLGERHIDELHIDEPHPGIAPSTTKRTQHSISFLINPNFNVS